MMDQQRISHSQIMKAFSDAEKEAYFEDVKGRRLDLGRWKQLFSEKIRNLLARRNDGNERESIGSIS